MKDEENSQFRVTEWLKSLKPGIHSRNYANGTELQSLLSIGYRINSVGEHPYRFSFAVEYNQRIVIINVTHNNGKQDGHED